MAGKTEIRLRTWVAEHTGEEFSTRALAQEWGVRQSHVSAVATTLCAEGVIYRSGWGRYASPRYDSQAMESLAREPLRAALSSAFEILAEVVQGLAHGDKPDRDYARIAVESLQQGAWALGLEFMGTRPTAEFLAALESARRRA